MIELAKKNAIVRRISALEDLANVNLVLTDKTGTLTKNEINIQDVIGYSSSRDDTLFYAYLSAKNDDRGDINLAILRKATEAKATRDGTYEITDFTPADSVRKRSSAVARLGGENIGIAVGAPQIVGSLCTVGDKGKKI